MSEKKGREASNITYEDFFTSGRPEHEGISSFQLRIPEFQRNYVWKKDRVVGLVDSILENNKNYYIGNIVIVRDERTGSSGRDKIVDGQQRLITLSLIIKALLEKKKTAKIKKLVFNNSVLRIIFQRDNLQKTYSDIINDKDIDYKLDDSQRIMYKSFFEIRKRIKELKIQEIDELCRKISFLEFVVIKCPDDNDAFQLFEGLNSTGLSLSATELTKNALLGRVKKIDKTKVGEVQDIWESVESSFEKENLVWFNKFLRHQWFSIGGYVNNPKLFEAIKDIIFSKNDIKIYLQYINDIKEDSEIYIYFRKANLSKEKFYDKMPDVAWRQVELLIKHIKQLNLDQVYALLLALYKFGKANKEYFKRAKFSQHIFKIWSFLLIMKYSKVSPSSYETIFADACYKIHRLKYKDFDKYMSLFFQKLAKIANVKEDFVQTINEEIYYEKIDRDMLRTILLIYLTSGRGVITEHTIEHIIPEGNLGNWKNIDKKYINEISVKSRHKLGNLTLLREDDVENNNFDYKYKNAYAKSEFIPNKELGKKYADDFNSENPAIAVEKRGIEIAESVFYICHKNLK